MKFLFVVLSTCLAVLVAAPAMALQPIAHRGEHVFHQEDTLSSLEAAYALAPRGTSESDVWQVADGVFMINHDATLGRSTNCTGYVYDYTSTWLRKHCLVDVNKAAAPQPMATLARELGALEHNPGQQMHLDLRQTWPRAKVVKLRNMIVAHHVRARVSVMAAGDFVLRQFRRYAPDVKTAWRHHRSDLSWAISVADARALGVKIVMIRNTSHYDAAYVAAMHRAGIEVWNQDCDKLGRTCWPLLKSWRVDRVMTNDLNAYKQVIG